MASLRSFILHLQIDWELQPTSDGKIIELPLIQPDIPEERSTTFRINPLEILNLLRLYSERAPFCRLSAGVAELPSELDFAFSLQSDECTAERLVMMSDDLVCRQDVRIPRAVRIADKGDIVPKTEGATTGCVDTKLGLNSCNNKPTDSQRLELMMQRCVLE